MTQAPAAPSLVERLRSPVAEQGDPKAVYRTRPVSLFEEAAAALEAQQARIAELEAELADVAIPSPYCEICGSCGSEGCGCEHKCKYAHSHPDVVRDMDALQALADRFEKALRELVALVRGECPRLLDEDSGGNAALSIEIDEALSSQGRHAGGEVGLPELPCGVGPSDLTDPQSQHSDGGRDV